MQSESAQIGGSTISEKALAISDWCLDVTIESGFWDPDPDPPPARSRPPPKAQFEIIRGPVK